MKFRPCIDLHHGQVKQIVGSTLRFTSPTTDNDDDTVTASSVPELATNFATERPAREFAERYARDGLTGGHVILLGPGNADAARAALRAAPGTLQVGGGVHDDNAREWLDAGASHVIVTSHVFSNGQIAMDRLERLVQLIGKERLVLDLSCRKRPDDHNNGPYYVVTNQWQVFTEYAVTTESLRTLAAYCDEFLVHGVDVEGLQCGILDDLVTLLATSPVPVTYAGGVRSIDDLNRVEQLGQGKVDCTVGSALDIFGGSLPYADVVAWHHQRNGGTVAPA